jgi:hypothetical protein
MYLSRVRVRRFHHKSDTVLALYEIILTKEGLFNANDSYTVIDKKTWRPDVKYNQLPRNIVGDGSFCEVVGACGKAADFLQPLLLFAALCNRMSLTLLIMKQVYHRVQLLF